MFKYERPEKEVVKEPQGVPVSCDGLSKKRNRLWLHLDNIIAKFLYQRQKPAAVNVVEGAEKDVWSYLRGSNSGMERAAQWRASWFMYTHFA
jgi:hypothetical protein